MKNLSFFLLLFTLTACSSGLVSSYTIKKSTHLKMNQTPKIGKTTSGQDLFLGGMSGLALKKVINENEILFSAITDRGPNGYNIGTERPFLLPAFSPQIVELKVNLKENRLDISNILKLKKKNGSPLTGLPNIRREESPIDISGFMISLDPEGMDTESIVSDGEGGFWIGEEYAPSISHFDSSGKLIRRLVPFHDLPKIYAERKPNKGFEGITKDDHFIFAFLQTSLPDDKSFSRIIEIDLNSLKTTAEYFYELDNGKSLIGDATALGNRKFLVVEHNGKKGDAGKKVVYKISLNETDKLVTKDLLVDLNLTPFKNNGKIEGIALIDNHRIAIVNDNDFQISERTDSKTGITPLNNDGNEMLILEFVEDITL